MLFLAALLCANSWIVQGGVITQGEMNGNMIALIKSSLAKAELSRANTRGRYCDDDHVKKELVCIMIECDYCKKWRNMNDVFERYNCPQPVGIQGDHTIAPTIIFETQMQAGSGGTSIPVCKVSLEDKSLFKDTCGKNVKKSRLPKKTSGWVFKSETINCNVINFEPVTTALLGANLAVIQVQTNQAMQEYDLVQGTSTVTQLASVHAEQAGDGVSHAVEADGTGTRSADSNNPVATAESMNLATDLALQSKIAADVSEKTQICNQAAVAFQAAQSEATSAHAIASQAAATRATAEKAAAAAATAVNVATNQLDQARAAVASAEKAFENAERAKVAYDAELKAAFDSELAAAQSVELASIKSKNLLNVTQVAQKELTLATQRQAATSRNVVSSDMMDDGPCWASAASQSSSASAGGDSRVLME